jgi:hypothetical protein
MFLEDDDTPLGDPNYSNMSTDIILPCATLLYHKNILLIDMVKNLSHLHVFDKNSTKVFTFTYLSTTISPSTRLNCKINQKEPNNVFSILSSPRQRPLPSSSNQMVVQQTSPFMMQHAKRINSFAQHLQGKVTKCRSFVDSLMKLICSDTVKHPHFFARMMNMIETMTILWIY